jgi:putative Ca2+/H+ antiporter (TMEM165/GDT1 family)
LRVIGVLVFLLVWASGNALAATPPHTILVFGDSLSAGYGLGDAAAKRIPFRAVRITAAALFAGLGVWVLVAPRFGA